jgi:hypothetical protein
MSNLEFYAVFPHPGLTGVSDTTTSHRQNPNLWIQCNSVVDSLRGMQYVS